MPKAKRIEFRKTDYRQLARKIATKYGSRVWVQRPTPEGYTMIVPIDFTEAEIEDVKSILAGVDILDGKDTSKLRKLKHQKVDEELAKIKDINDVKKQLKPMLHSLLWLLKQQLGEEE